ncbi:hypothetical protein [Paraburkholderia sp. RL17-337-BIB-A]|uniref:hypothetical protein n=1 Tax=Paraburkholderia sp. RL17-337-BIB-A TaxID=3031636 RepID=UPI0038BCDD50
MRSLVQAIVISAVTTWGANCYAASVAAPMGIEVGKTTCDQVEAKLNGTQGVSGNKDQSSWSKGTMFVLDKVDGFGVDGLQKMLIVCGPSNVTMLVEMTFNKGGMGNPAVQSTAHQLDSKYSPVRKNLPELADGSALWKAPNASIELQYAFMNFSFDVDYWSPGAEVSYKKWVTAQQKESAQKKTNQL